jgi:hypothetical protein
MKSILRNVCVCESDLINALMGSYVTRFDEQQVYEDSFEKVKRKHERHIQYPLAFKVEVAAFAERHSQIVAARTFNVSRKRVFEWLQLCKAKFAKGVPYLHIYHLQSYTPKIGIKF